MALMPRMLGMGMVVLLCAGTAHAASADLGCGYSTVYDVYIERGGVKLQRLREHYVFEADRVLHNGRALTLTPEQRALAQEYRQALETLVPAIAQLAMRGALLGFETLSLTAAALSGDERELEHAATRIETFALRLAPVLDGRRLPASTHLELSDFDEELGSIATAAAANLTASALASVSRALLSPGRTAGHGEHLGSLVERRVERGAQALETEADEICRRLQTVDALEARLGIVDAFQSRRAI